MIGDSLDRLLTDHWDRHRMADPAPHAAMRSDLWSRLAALGLLGAVLPEGWGGIGGGPGEVLVVARTFGRHGADPALLSGLMLGAGALVDLDDVQWPFDPEAVGNGDLRLALGVFEAGRRYDIAPQALRARPDGESWRLDGAKQHVLDADLADWLVLCAALDDGSSDDGLFIVPRSSAGLAVRPYPAVGGASLSRVECDELRVAGGALVARGAKARRQLERALARARFWAAAETLGTCEAALAQTVEYLGIREQFGRRLASFQALQHRLADAHAELELLRSLVLGLRLELEAQPDGARAARDLAAAGALAAEIGDLIGREAIQLHGAIGMTQELGVGRTLMRVDFLWRLLGDAREQRDRLFETLPALEAAAP